MSRTSPWAPTVVSLMFTTRALPSGEVAMLLNTFRTLSRKGWSRSLSLPTLLALLKSTCPILPVEDLPALEGRISAM